MLVDDQKLIREGIKSLLAMSQVVSVVAEANDGEAALSLLNDKIIVDIVLMDIRMPKMNGIETLREMNKVNCYVPVLMLTTFDDNQMVTEATKLGAKGYLLKDVSLETLVDSIEKIVSGRTMIQPAITENLLQGLKSIQIGSEDIIDNPIEKLTEKESEILRLIASGYSNRDIADAMFKSEGTIKNQISVILAKMGVRDRTRAVLKAIETGLIC